MTLKPSSGWATTKLSSSISSLKSVETVLKLWVDPNWNAKLRISYLTSSPPKFSLDRVSVSHLCFLCVQNAGSLWDLSSWPQLCIGHAESRFIMISEEKQAWQRNRSVFYTLLKMPKSCCVLETQTVTSEKAQSIVYMTHLVSYTWYQVANCMVVARAPLSIMTFEVGFTASNS